MKRSKKYPKSTNAWMAERGWADLTGCLRYVRDAVLLVGILWRWHHARVFAPAWVMRVYLTLEKTEKGFYASETTREDFAAVLRAVGENPRAFDQEVALAAYRLGGRAALLGALGVV